MPQKKPCPRCGPDGDVAVSAPGVAACRVCGGSFVSSKVLVPALIAAGIAPAQLKEIVAKDGRKARPCPTCDQLLTSFPVRRELVHACTPCGAMWVDDGALLRLGGVDPARLVAEAAPSVAAPVPPAAPAPAAAPVAPPAFARGDRQAALATSSGLDLDTSRRSGPSRRTSAAAAGVGAAVDAPEAPPVDDANPLGIFAPEPAAPVDDTPFSPVVSSFSERGGSGTPLVGVALKLGVAAIMLGGMYWIVATAFMKGEPTPIGGGMEALFWDQEIETRGAMLQGQPVKRLVSTWGTNTLEAMYVRGGGGDVVDVSRNGKPELAVSTFHGSTRMIGSPMNHRGDVFFVELEFVDESDPFKTNKNVGGYCRYYFNANDAWLLCGYSDSGMFMRSGKSMSFVESLRKAGSEGAASKSASGGTSRAGAAVGLVGDTE